MSAIPTGPLSTARQHAAQARGAIAAGDATAAWAATINAVRFYRVHALHCSRYWGQMAVDTLYDPDGSAWAAKVAAYWYRVGRGESS